MILVVGHGPSAERADPEWIDKQDFVVRIFTGRFSHKLGGYEPHVGTKVDVLVTSRPRNMYGRSQLNWWLEADYRDMCNEMKAPFTVKKLSNGTVGCLIAHHLYPDKEIGVIGFDTTMTGWNLGKKGFWPFHDAPGEGKILRSIGVKDYGRYE